MPSCIHDTPFSTSPIISAPLQAWCVSESRGAPGRSVDLKTAGTTLMQTAEEVRTQNQLVETGGNPGKAVGLLAASAICARSMLGARMTSCKSAKDPTTSPTFSRESAWHAI